MSSSDGVALDDWTGLLCSSLSAKIAGFAVSAGFGQAGLRCDFERTSAMSIIMQPKHKGGTRSQAYPCDTSAMLRELIARYRREKEPIEVNFRELVSWIKVGERATHYLHPYPGKLLPHIPHFFLAATDISAELVHDPFGGSGTVALEAVLAGKNSSFCDANPLARLIAEVKVTGYSTATLRRALHETKEVFEKITSVPLLEFNNVDYWYTKSTRRYLSLLKHSIDVTQKGKALKFMLVCFSVLVRKLSLADPRLSVPVLKEAYANERSPSKSAIWANFEALCERNIARAMSFSAHRGRGRNIYVGDSALDYCGAGLGVPPGGIDMVITSPPYGGAQKYIRASSLSLGWLGFTEKTSLREFERVSIGREHYSKHEILQEYKLGIEDAEAVVQRVRSVNPLRAHIAANYLMEMREALAQIHRSIRAGGSFVLIIGNNEVCGIPFLSSEYLRRYCQELGFSLELCLIDTIKSRGLMTKRNKTAGIISREWVYLFRKG